MLEQDLKATIQKGYSDFLKARGLKPRLGQKQMIGAIASALGEAKLDPEGNLAGDPPLCVVEAGTGTGKTLAYLLATLPVARALDKTVVIATGTTSLQGQLLDKDIPELVAATGWHYRFALAKGRGRYLCNIRLEQCRDAVAASDSNLYLFEDEIPFNADKAGVRLITAMDEELAGGGWDGDRDNWADHIPDHLWGALTIDRRQCAGRRCRKVQECCFFRARESLEDADCIIANHDLVLSDLALGGGVILPPPEQTLYIFDEAHRLADVALRHFGASAHLQGTVQWLEQIQKGLAAGQRHVGGDPELARKLEAAGRALEDAHQRLRDALPLFRRQLDDLLPPGSDHYRYPHGDIGEANRELCSHLAQVFDVLEARLGELGRELEQALDNPHHAVPRVDLEQLFQGVGQWHGRAEAVTGLWQRMAEPDEGGQPPLARWLALDEQGDDVVVSVSPVSAAEILRERLWQRCFAAVATSATLRALGSFNRFAGSTGLPDHAHTLAVPGAFDYARAGVLAIPDIGADGGDPMAHTRAVTDHLPGLLQGDEASLVLFSSRRQMETVADGLAADLRARVLVQGAYSHGEILRRHRQAVDAGEGSIIFGLASFAEGMDLPGNYCNHVVIAKLPFAVPDNPLQAAQSEWLEARGHNPFKAMTLPDASLRLIQACGRLLRSESDRGRVTILDRRLLTKFYGRQLLDALPPFRREVD